MKPLSFMEKRRAGLWDISSTMRSTVRIPSSARESMTGSENWTIGIPETAVLAPPFFSSIVCGAWSVPMVVILPSRRAFRKESRSDTDFIAGLHLIFVPRDG